MLTAKEAREIYIKNIEKRCDVNKYMECIRKAVEQEKNSVWVDLPSFATTRDEIKNMTNEFIITERETSSNLTASTSENFIINMDEESEICHQYIKNILIELGYKTIVFKCYGYDPNGCSYIMKIKW